jgi:hypothetical protein
MTEEEAIAAAGELLDMTRAGGAAAGTELLAAPGEADAAEPEASTEPYDPVEARQQNQPDAVLHRERQQMFRDVTEAGMKFAAKLPLNISAGVWSAFDNALGLVSDVETREVVREISPAAPEFMLEIERALGKPTAGDEMIQELAQWGVPFFAYLKGLTVLSGGGQVTQATAAQGLAADIAATFAHVDPHIGRLSQTMREFGLQYELLDYLASEEGTETENRFRNTLEMAGFGVATVAAYKAAQSLKGAYDLVRGSAAMRAGAAAGAAAVAMDDVEAPDDAGE